MLAEAIAARESRASEEGPRPFDLGRDLGPLADLMDRAFVSEAEPTRVPIVAEMRRLAKAGPLLWLFDASYAALAPLMRGFVWISKGRLVGNVTLSPDGGHRGLWIISNVAVDPDFRGHGIAHQLMEASLQEARGKGARMVLLEVQTDNAPAQQLYGELGFKTYDTVAELSLPALNRPGQQPLAPVPLRPRRPRDAQELYEFFQAVTPAAVQAIKPILPSHYHMDFWMRLERWLDDVLYRCQRSDWIREQGGNISGVLQLTGQYTNAAHRVQIDVLPTHRGTLEDALLAAGLHKLGAFPERDVTTTVSTSHPQALEAFRRAGFRTIRTLDQMRTT
jgi:GNAT superfamily N-acetyltransferase